MEHVWGAFRLNLYVISAWLGSLAASFLVPGLPLDSSYMVEGMFFAFAFTFPDVIIMAAGIIPIRAKWLGLGVGGVFLYEFLGSGMMWKLGMLVAFSNFFVFAAMGWLRKEAGRRSFGRKVKEAISRPVHACAACGMDELKNPDLEFRYCSDCDKEYCLAHLENHKHG